MNDRTKEETGGSEVSELSDQWEDWWDRPIYRVACTLCGGALSAGLDTSDTSDRDPYGRCVTCATPVEVQLALAPWIGRCRVCGKGKAPPACPGRCTRLYALEYIHHEIQKIRGRCSMGRAFSANGNGVGTSVFGIC